MNIEEFYAQDERRRSSIEFELGREWRDASNVRYELSWIEDTGELYLMREPVPEFFEDPLGGFHVDKEQVDGLQVHVLCLVGSHEHLMEALTGWEDAMGSSDGISWLSAKLDNAGLRNR
jgi:hypothetical protein